MATPGELHGARLKLKRANKHIADLNVALRAFKKSKPRKVSTKRNAKGHLIYYVRSLAPVPHDLGIIAGDALFNLRSALDHLAMQLSIAGGGRPDDREVMFPICDSAAKVDAAIAKIKHFGPLTIKAIKAIEPYKGGRGHQLWVLHRLNIIDKHRLLLTVSIGGKPLDFGHLVHSFLRKSGKAIGKPTSTVFKQDDVLYSCEVGDELLTDQSRNAKFNKYMKFPFEVSFNEAEVSGSDSIVKIRQDMSKVITNVINQLGKLL